MTDDPGLSANQRTPVRTLCPPRTASCPTLSPPFLLSEMLYRLDISRTEPWHWVNSRPSDAARAGTGTPSPGAPRFPVLDEKGTDQPAASRVACSKPFGER